ncbi:MAG: hypothetical protein OXF23_06830 [Candidatus Dadabacteria bacterium]|nr:hypothetical protein [Candidatus Dadabacteria bacterium]
MENYSWVFLSIVALVSLASFIVSLFDRNKKKGEWEGSVNSRLDALEKGLKDILDLFLKRGSPVAESSSPINLTDLGKDIARKISARKWASDLAESLIKEVVEVAGKHPYEIEEFSFQYMRGNPRLSEDMKQKVKETAYEKGITQRDVLDVLALELRDEIIANLHK